MTFAEVRIDTKDGSRRPGERGSAVPHSDQHGLARNIMPERPNGFCRRYEKCREGEN